MRAITPGPTRASPTAGFWWRRNHPTLGWGYYLMTRGDGGKAAL